MSAVYFIIISLVAGILCKNEMYMGYHLYNINFKTREQDSKFGSMKSDIIDFLRKPCLKNNVSGLAMVPPSHVEWFEEKLEELDLIRDIVVDDVYKFLVEKDHLNRNVNEAVFDFNSYHRYDKILDYIKSIVEEYSNSNETLIELVEAGTTDENRPIVYLKITANSSAIAQKPIVVIEAGINPREWITVPAALNIVNKTIEESQRRLLENLEWIIIPVLNPDGYEYTHTNLRLWTKSRSTRSHLGHICPGVNINRNFDIDWLFSDSSSSPCSHLYGGTEAFSEPESRVIRNLIQEYGSRIKLYVSLQNNGAFVSYPWQYERAASGMFRQHHVLGSDMIAAMGNYTLDVGSVALGDRVSGTSTDYVMDNGVLYTFNVNIDNDGVDNVVIPEVEIRPIADRIWNAVEVAADGVIQQINLNPEDERS